MGMGKKKAKRWSRQVVDMVKTITKGKHKQFEEQERQRLKKIDNHMPAESKDNSWRVLMRKAH